MIVVVLILAFAGLPCAYVMGAVMRGQRADEEVSTLQARLDAQHD